LFPELSLHLFILGLPRYSVVKNLPANAGDACSILGWGGSPGGGNGNPLQYSCLENLIDRGAWQATVHGVASHASESVLDAKDKIVHEKMPSRSS